MKILSTISTWDERIVVDVATHRSRAMNSLMTGLTRIGDGWGWFILAGFILIFDFKRADEVLGVLAFGFALEIALYKKLKRSFCRQRPFRKCAEIFCPVCPADEFSFPSGHTAAAFVVVSIAGAVYPWLFLPLCTLAGLIGVSRVYLGAHYPSDVVAGLVLGTLCGEIAKLLFSIP